MHVHSAGGEEEKQSMSRLLGCGRAAALAATITTSTGVHLGVGGKMVGAGKSALALVTHVRAATSVLAHVAGELVRAGELPVTALPCAVKGALASVRAGVGLEVRRLGVALGAAVKVAHIGAVAQKDQRALALAGTRLLGGGVALDGAAHYRSHLLLRV